MMLSRINDYLIILISAVFLMLPEAVSQNSEAQKPLPTITAKTAGMTAMPGFFPYYWDEKTGKIWLEIDRFDQEFIYLHSLPAGVGSNTIGLDRGQLGRERIVKFYRAGPKVLLLEPNYRYRAAAGSPAEAKAVESSFAQSVLGGFQISASENGKVLIDLTPFLLTDAHGVVRTIKQNRQGNFKADPERSVIYLPNTKNFPRNSEFEVLMTFSGENPGDLLRSVVPTPDLVTVRQHFSFIKLPEDGYKPRKLDRRAGYFGRQYFDYSTAIDQPLEQWLLTRFRLQKKDPTAAVSEVVKPLVFYVDHAAPEPIRQALVDGARWWGEAFEAAGFKNAYRVEILPEDVDPMDVRYNVIQWVHRSTRGWSYGEAISDPRTGEIIKGHVSLGSLRVRQDYLIAEGLLAPYKDGAAASPAMKEMALARLRQLSAHEVGHTLGLGHNFAASSFGRTSVMDYPHPLATINAAGEIDLSDAYDSGIGEWDKVSIRYGYSEFAAGENEAQALENILREAAARGLYFISNDDARPPGSSHPAAHLWDNGADPAVELNRVMKIRRKALAQFGAANIPAGEPMASLEEVLVPVYYFHRYQVEAAVKLLGGIDYRYAMRSDQQLVQMPISAERQHQALSELLATLSPEALLIPEHILRLIPPRAFAMQPGPETLPSRSGRGLDPYAAAEAAANMTVGLLLNRQRAERLVQMHATHDDYPGLDEVIEKLIKVSWRQNRKDNLAGGVQQVVDNVVLFQLMQLANNPEASTQVRAIANAQLDKLRSFLVAKPNYWKSDLQKAHINYALDRIKRFNTDPDDFPVSTPARAPAGSPIGGGAMHCDF